MPLLFQTLRVCARRAIPMHTTLTRCASYSIPRLYSTSPVVRKDAAPSRVVRPPQRIHLGNLSPAPGSKNKPKRVGRGPGSRRGGTSGRGHKGQLARSGKPMYAAFEGGQSPITRRFPKRGFNNYMVKKYEPLNLDRLQHWIDTGRITLSPDKALTAYDLLQSRCVHQMQDGVKLLGDGGLYFKSPIKIIVSRASQSAIKAIEKAGGTVVCRHYNELGIRDLRKNNTSHRLAAPMRQKDILFYSDWKTNRGYIGMPNKILEDPAFANARLDVPTHLLPPHRLPPSGAPASSGEVVSVSVASVTIPAAMIQAQDVPAASQPSAQ